MKITQTGFGVVQIVAVVAAVAMASLVAIPKYKAYLEKAKLTEAFTLAGDSRKKLNEFYSLTGRFPNTDIEADSVLPETLTEPEYVEKIVINHEDEVNDIVIEAHMKDGVIESGFGEDQYVYMAANRSTKPGVQIEWSCGAVGINVELLPERCRK